MLEARALLARARQAPRDTRQQVAARIEAGTSDRGLLAVLHVARGWAAFTLGDTATALEAARHAQGLAGTGPEQLIESTHLEVAALLEQSRPEEAIGSLTATIAECIGFNRARLWSGLGSVHASLRDFDRARACYRRGVAEAERFDDRPSRSILENNEALVDLELGRFVEARARLEGVLRAGPDDRDRYPWAIATHNLGVCAARLGRIPTAIGLFEQAAASFDDTGDRVSLAHALLDRAEMLHDVGLLAEALAAVTRAAELFRSIGSGVRTAMAQVTMAQVLATQGRWVEACDTLSAARREVGAARLDPTIGDLIDGRLALYRTIAWIGGEGDQVGRPELPALSTIDAYQPDVAVDAGLLLIEHDRSDEARRLLRTVAPLDDPERQVTYLHALVARAALAQLEGDEEVALDAVWAGLAHAHTHGIALGVAELRATTQRRARQLAEIGVTIGHRQRRLGLVIEVLEAERALGLLPEPDLTEQERALSANLRSVSRSLAGVADESPATFRLLSQRRELEQAISRLHRSGGERPSGKPTRNSRRGATLAPDTVLLHRKADRLQAIVPDDGRLRVIELGRLDRLRRTLAGLALTLGSLAGGGSPVAVDRLVDDLRTEFAGLLRHFDGRDDVVVVPEPSLGPVPWSLLTDTAVILHPSPTLQPVAAREIGEPARPVVAFAGPDLRYAEAEVDAVLGAHPGAQAFRADEADASHAVDWFGRAGLVHFAAHGMFRADNPLYSSILLADGPLTFFDLLSGPPPERLIFSSCDVGRGSVVSSLGLASVLIGRGCRELVVSSGPVGDEASMRLMSDLHRGLAAGKALGRALREAQTARLRSDPSVALFAAFGSGASADFSRARRSQEEESSVTPVPELVARAVADSVRGGANVADAEGESG
ncbi:MAG: CHAT domain-containing protein [Acidimicrobiales bacterium]